MHYDNDTWDEGDYPYDEINDEPLMLPTEYKYEPTAQEKIEKDVAQAHRNLKQFISELVVKNLREMNKNRLPCSVYSLEFHINDFSEKVTNYFTGESFIVIRRSQGKSKIRMNLRDAMFYREKLFEFEPVSLEKFYLTGEWIIRGVDFMYGADGQLEIAEVTFEEVFS